MKSTSTMFIQVKCGYNSYDLNVRQVEGLLIGCFGVFIALFFVIYIDYVKSVAKNDFVEWDVKTITAGDYSVEMDISEDMWNNFVAAEYNPLTNKKSKVQHFRDILRKELNKRFSSLPNLGFEEDEDEVRIAQITFAFNNAQIINMLKTRGAFIKNQKYDDMRKIDKELDEYKTNNYEMLNRPVTAFIIMESEEGLNRAKQYEELVKDDDQYAEIRNFHGEKLSFDDASEPTDIIWENRHFTKFDRLKRGTGVFLVIAFCLAISFVLIFMCSSFSVGKLTMYPIVDCKEFMKSPTVFNQAFQEY